jgi:hypothetical protein
MDVVLMRRDPPVDADYLHDSHVLSLAQAEGVLVSNDPQGLRDLNEKLAALLFPQCCPPTLVSRDCRRCARSSPSTAMRAQAAGRHGRALDLPGHGRRAQRERDPGDADRRRPPPGDGAALPAREMPRQGQYKRNMHCWWYGRGDTQECALSTCTGPASAGRGWFIRATWRHGRTAARKVQSCCHVLGLL